MKLSELKDLVANIEAAALVTNPDPDIQFWVPRMRIKDEEVKESQHFVQFEPRVGIAGVEVQHHRVCVSPDNLAVLAKLGDFHIPASVMPFYR